MAEVGWCTDVLASRSRIHDRFAGLGDVRHVLEVRRGTDVVLRRGSDGDGVPGDVSQMAEVGGQPDVLFGELRLDVGRARVFGREAQVNRLVIRRTLSSLHRLVLPEELVCTSTRRTLSSSD